MNDLGKIIIYNDELGITKIEVKIIENDIWLMQDQIVELYQSSKSNISEHIKHILQDGELNENSVVRNYRTTASDGKLYNKKYYNLEMIIAIGYRVRSQVGINFRNWASSTLKEYMQKGFVMNDELLKQAGGGSYFKELLNRIRDIRSSEKIFYRQILDLFATSVDYNSQSELTLELFKTIQNKMHWAAHGHTAAELIHERANAEQPFMGLTTFKGNSPTIDEVTIAKNYLNEKEIKQLNLLVTTYLDFAELQALNEKPMYMKDWINELDYFIKMNRKDILETTGFISHEKAVQKARNEYLVYKETQKDKLSIIEKDYIDSVKKMDKLLYNKKE